MLGMTQILSHPEATRDPPVLPLAKAQFILEHLSHIHKLTAILGFSALACSSSSALRSNGPSSGPGASGSASSQRFSLSSLAQPVRTGYHLAVKTF